MPSSALTIFKFEGQVRSMEEIRKPGPLRGRNMTVWDVRIFCPLQGSSKEDDKRPVQKLLVRTMYPDPRAVVSR